MERHSVANPDVRPYMRTVIPTSNLDTLEYIHCLRKLRLSGGYNKYQ